MNNNILIFEGADNTGKTNIGQAVARITGQSYFKNHREDSHFTDKTFMLALKYEGPFLLSLLEQVNFGNGIVIDRSIPSEYAYAQAYHRETDQDLIWHLDARLAKLGASIVFCYKTKYRCFEDIHVSLDDVALIETGYREYFKFSRIPVLYLDTTDENLLGQINRIMKGLFSA